MQTADVSSLSQFVDWVEAVGDDFTDEEGFAAPWFRGLGSSEFKLIPGLYRTESGRDAYSDDEVRFEFSRRALPLVADRPPRDEWEWYFLMQHYRAPTRLLDWTDSALVALYFALSAWSPKHAKPPAVCSINSMLFNSHADIYGPAAGDDVPRYLPLPFTGAKIPALPIAIDPTFIAQRMLVQRSHFTIHGSDPRGIDELLGDLQIEDQFHVVYVNADEDGIERLRWHLALLGITETSIFPDLEGLARELRFEYQLDKTRPKTT